VRHLVAGTLQRFHLFGDLAHALVSALQARLQQMTRLAKNLGLLKKIFKELFVLR
jgi:hypothetical protein